MDGANTPGRFEPWFLSPVFRPKLKCLIKILADARFADCIRPITSARTITSASFLFLFLELKKANRLLCATVVNTVLMNLDRTSPENNRQRPKPADLAVKMSAVILNFVRIAANGYKTNRCQCSGVRPSAAGLGCQVSGVKKKKTGDRRQTTEDWIWLFPVSEGSFCWHLTPEHWNPVMWNWKCKFDSKY